MKKLKKYIFAAFSARDNFCGDNFKLQRQHQRIFTHGLIKAYKILLKDN